MDRAEFNEFAADYSKRFPAVSEYVKKRSEENQRALCRSWYETLAPHPIEIARRVTQEIVAGRMPPVQNVDLGQWAEQVRQRCRQLRDQDREQDRRTRPDEDKRPPARPLPQSAQRALRHLLATMAIRRERGQDDTPETTRVTPWNWSGAVILLADGTTEQGERDAHATLASEGLDWGEISQRATTTTTTLWNEVETDEEGTIH